MNDMQSRPFPIGSGWEKTGLFIQDHGAQTSKEAMGIAKLDWSVEEKELYTIEGTTISGGIAVPKTRKITTHKAIVRTDTNSQLGIVGKNYRPVQNSEAFGFMDNLVQEGKMEYHSAGTFRGGRRIWLLGKVGEIEILNGDVVDQFILLFNSHDGGSALSALLTHIRLLCTNAIAGLVAQGKGVMHRHTKNILERMSSADEIFAAAATEFNYSSRILKQSAQTVLTDEQWLSITKQIFKDPPKEKEHLLPRVEQRRDDLTELFYNGVGQDVPGIQNTVWAGINAVTEYANFHKPTRGENKEERRLESTLFGLNNKWIDKNVGLLLAA